jgi:hypothetical protein
MKRFLKDLPLEYQTNQVAGLAVVCNVDEMVTK